MLLFTTPLLPGAWRTEGPQTAPERGNGAGGNRWVVLQKAPCTRHPAPEVQSGETSRHFSRRFTCGSPPFRFVPWGLGTPPPSSGS